MKKRLWNAFQWLFLFSVFFFLGGVGLRDNYEVKAVPGKTYENLKIFADVLERVQDNYIEEVDMEELKVEGLTR